MRARPRGPANYVSVANIGGHHLLDSWNYSNWAAFINHGEPGIANVVASVFGACNNRVAIHVGDADIHRNQELLLCYSDDMSLYFESLRAQEKKDKTKTGNYIQRKKTVEQKIEEDEAVEEQERPKKKHKRKSRSPSPPAAAPRSRRSSS